MLTKPRKNKPTGKVKTILGLQPLTLIEGDALTAYASDYSEDEIRRMREFVARYTRLPGLLDATIDEANDDKA